MTDPTPIQASGGPADRSRSGSPLGQRRSFLVNKRYQLRASLLTATVVLVLLIFVNLILYTSSSRSSSAILANSPELEKLLHGQDRVQLGLVLVASLVFLIGVFVVSILETHKTAGAAYNIQQRLEDLRAGRYAASLTLRRGDNLVELEQTFNALARTLRERELEDATALQQMATDAPTDPSGVAGRLREMAARKNERLRGA